MRLVVITLVLLVAARASADDEIVRGAVLKVEQREIYVNVGAKQGVGDGAALRIKRTITLRHPVTRAPITDWIPVGSAQVTQAGTTLSRAIVGDLIDAIRIGDVVEVLVDRPDAERAPEAPRPQAAAGPPIDPVTAEVLAVFAGQTGKPIEARIAAWERYLSTHGDSRFADAIRRDIDGLRGLREQLQPAATVQGNETVTEVEHAARASAPAGAAIPVVFVLAQPERVASAFLHYRTGNARTYRQLLLVREHDLYLRGAIPADTVVPPGVDYFVEVSTPSGSSGLALGTPAAPLHITVAPPPLIDRFASTPGKSSVKLSADYLDFATFDKRDGNHVDHQVSANVDFTYRLDSVVQAIGVGYGVFAGTGGFANAAWTTADPAPQSGFHYGYADVELGGVQQKVHLSGAGRVIAGVGKDGFGLGAEGRFRIGDRDATNLLFAASTISEVGFLSEIRFGARPARDLMIGISVGATDQPNRGDVGVKLGTELEWVGIRNVSLIVRGSWQGRNVNHGGLGAGGGLGVYW